MIIYKTVVKQKKAFNNEDKFYYLKKKFVTLITLLIYRKTTVNATVPQKYSLSM